MCCKCKCVRWLWNKICDFFRWLYNCCCDYCCHRDYENLPGNVRNRNLPDNVRNINLPDNVRLTVYVTPFKTKSSGIESLCEPLQRVLNEKMINIILEFTNQMQENNLQWFAYCCTGREEEVKGELQRQSNEKNLLVVFLDKNYTSLDINNTLFVKYTETDGHYNVELMDCKSERNEEVLGRLRRITTINT